jgi:hypothetical protein
MPRVAVICLTLGRDASEFLGGYESKEKVRKSPNPFNLAALKQRFAAVGGCNHAR